MIGTQYNHWTIIESLGTNKFHKAIVLAKCKCGKIKKIQLGNLKSGISKSCGCFKKELKRKTSNKPLGIAAANSLFYSYKAGAKRRNIVFNLSFEEFLYLTKQDCYYCGIEPKQEYALYWSKGPNKGKLRINGSYIYNGIDRINSDLDYNLQNSVTCCIICNKAKSDLTVLDFLGWVKRIFAHQQGKNNETFSSC